MAAITLGVLGAQEMGKDDAPLFRVATQSIGAWGGWLVLTAVLLALPKAIIGQLMSVSRVILAMGEARELPAWFGVVHPKYHVQRHAVLAIGVLIFAFALFFDLRALIPLASFYLLVWFSITNFSALKLPKDQRFLSPAWSWMGLACCVALVTVIPPLTIGIGVATVAGALGLRTLIRHRPISRP